MEPARILNINDNDTSRFTISRLLQHEGFEMLEAPTGMEGLERAIQDQPDLVLCDIRLPDIDGYEVCRRLRADPRTSKIPLVHITAHALGTVRKIESLEIGAEGYLTYPVERLHLSATVRSLLRSRGFERDRERLLEVSVRERASLEKALRELEEERRFREQFVATLSHDLRTPLTAARLKLESFARTSADPKAPEALRRAIAQIDRADGMIRDLLDVTLVSSGRALPLRLQEADIGAVADEIVETFAVPVKASIEFSRSGDLRGVWDSEGIRRTIENLLQNAIKYGAEGSPVVCSLSGDAERVEIRVRNQGTPIAASQIPGLFDPFRRSADHSRSDGPTGWGLGLAVVKGMVDAHGGTVTVESSAESGTEFRIVLPKNAKGSPGAPFAEPNPARGET